MKLYYGVVENNIDLEKLGRVQVRVVGKHTENRTDSAQADYMPVVDLPWAQTLQAGTTISNQGGFQIPKNGTVVIISFMDADEQIPIILGSVPKIADTLPDFTQGFTDPNGVNPSVDSIGVSPVSNYATGEPEPAAVTEKKLDAEVGVTCINDIWNEPPTTFDPVYPLNLVIQNGDNVFELDDTLLKNRINLQHSTGTFTETHPDGVQVKKIKGKEYIIVEGDRNILIKANSNVTVNGISNTEAAILNLKGTTSITVDSDGVLTINAASGSIAVNGLLTVTASLLSLN